MIYLKSLPVFHTVYYSVYSLGVIRFISILYFYIEVKYGLVTRVAKGRDS